MFPRRKSYWLVCSLLLCASTTLAAEPGSTSAGAEPSASVVLVLDASSSMLGKLGKATKMNVARDVTHELIGSWDTHLNVGLTAYGHRRSKDCNDIEAVVPLGPLNPESFNAAVDGLKPKGKTPLAAAIKNAAEQLGSTQRKATIIVISDGIENCGGDPCAVAAELEKKGIEFTAHVVGLGSISAAESKQLACIAEKTGGEYRGAKDAAALKEALGGLVQQVEQEGGLRPPISGANGASLRQLPEETTSNVKIVAVRTPGGVPLKTVWRIWNADKSKQVGLVDQRPSASFSLPPGQYRLVAYASNATNGNAAADLPFEVGPGKNHVLELAYNSGRVTFANFEFEGGPPLKSINDIRPDGSKRLSATAQAHSKPSFELLAGKYVLRVRAGENAQVTHSFEVQPGSDNSQNIYLNVGKIRLRAVPSPGGTPISKIHWNVFQRNPDGSRGSRVATEDYRSHPRFMLVPGDYVVRIDIDGRKATEHPISVRTGAEASEEFVVGP
ncbi:MAG TPA: VWA domain-containing protein [Polyangiaceae bacterium]|nr:VWA domain-containing protein [Polyangiaceae bacterium]